MRPKPLHGIRVLDLTRLLPGPVCTLHLADMGADVIKIEDPDTGDYARWQEPVQVEHSAYFLCVNRNKRSLTVNLRSEEGRAIFMTLARDADVIVEGFRPGVVDRLGIGYAQVRELNPRIVYAAISGYGQDGPYRLRAGHDVNYCSYAGVTDQIGVAGGAPVVGNFQVADLLGGSASAVVGILAALVDARATGRGRYVDISMTDCTLAHAVIAFSNMLAHGRPTSRGEGFISGELPCYAIYETSDKRYMSLGALEEKFWHCFCDAIERPDLRAQHWISGEQARAIREEVAGIFLSRTQAEWTALGEAHDCCLSPVLDMRESMENPQLRHRRMFVETEHPVDGPVTQLAFPIKFSEFDFEIERPAPGHGEHTSDILADLGYTAEAISGFRRDGVV
jgi:alpha-methylacyl-CoA racemase